MVKNSARSLAVAFALLSAAALAQQTQLPPPGSIVTPPAAPNPQSPPAASPAPAPEQNRAPEVGGPTDVVLEAKPVLLLRGQSNWDDGFDNLMEAFKKLREEAARLKLKTVGQPQAAFISIDDYGFKYEAMVTLEETAPEPKPRVGADMAFGMSPSGKALKFTHSGAYDDIDTTYEAITAYLDEKGLKARNLFVEEYMTEPKTSEDADLQMNILVLIE